MQIDFSAAFDIVNHQGILYRLCSVGIGGSVLSILLLLLLLLKNIGSARLRESNIHPIIPKTPAPQNQPIDRKKRNRKRVEDYSRDRAA